jgi:hypothetical protein
VSAMRCNDFVSMSADGLTMRPPIWPQKSAPAAFRRRRPPCRSFDAREQAAYPAELRRRCSHHPSSASARESAGRDRSLFMARPIASPIAVCCRRCRPASSAVALRWRSNVVAPAGRRWYQQNQTDAVAARRATKW